jgi:hydroxypyruvate reductase
MDIQRLQTHTLRTAPWGAAVSRMLAAALDAVEPAGAVRRYLRCEGDTLWVDQQAYDLRTYERVLLVGAGKAGAPMAQAAAEIVGDVLAAGVVIVKDTEGEGGENGPTLSAPLVLHKARHPLPDERGVAATRQVAELLEHTTDNDLVLVLVSGGGSALLTLPVAGVGLDDMQRLTNMLLASGASINEMNCLRKHLDTVKGGGLARMAAPAAVATLVLSDVVGNPLDVIASGPTVPDSTTFADALAVLDRYGLRDEAPPAVVAHLRAGAGGETPDTPKAGDPVFARVQHVLVASNRQAAAAARQAAQAEGYQARIVTTYAQGEARVVGRFLAAIARELVTSEAPLLPRPTCLIVGGETTVTLRGDGRGGRNQEMALAAVRDMAGLEGMALVTLATDGGDGPTDAAGAVVSGDTLERAQAQGLDPDAALANNDAYPFFAALDELLRPGTTQTNVNDLALVLAF